MIAVTDVVKRFGDSVAVDGVTLRVPEGGALALVGLSGSGKSTVLRLITGLEWPESGTVVVSDEAVTRESIARVRPRLGYVIQDGGLFPHLSCRRNVTLLAELRGMNDTSIAARVVELADLVRLTPQLLDRFPHELSGGQRQRVALMRALFLDPPVLLLDEPFGALDPIVRREIGDELFALLLRLRKTVLLVTHDVAEAAALADEIAVMRAGRVVQTGTLEALRASPADSFVTQFIEAHRNLAPVASSGHP
jgi:osmoprotectant transport system ATP-binding protein